MPKQQKVHPKAAAKNYSPKEYNPAGWLAKQSRVDRRQKRGWNRGRK